MEKTTKATKDWFAKCETNDEVKAEYRKLCKALHPDNGGDAEEFKAMTSAFTEAFERVKNYKRNAKGEKYEKPTEERPEEFMNALNAIIHLSNIVIEICGTWVWVTGDTKPYKDILKNAGYHYCGSKKAWQWHSKLEDITGRRGHISMARIRDLYGSEKVKNEEQKVIA